MNMELTIRKGTAEDTQAFLDLLREVRNGMPRPEWFYLDPDETVRELMRDGRMHLIVAMDGDQLAGAFDWVAPGLDAFNYGRDLGFSDELLMRVANMDSVAVLPQYRGRGLHRQLQAAAEQDAKEAGFRILLCTIHPDNCYSLNNALHLGYEIAAKLPKYGSVRYLLRKDV